MASSEEYLASLGFDVSDVDKSVDQTITILGHLGTAFDGVAGRADKAARALSGGAKGYKDTQTAATGAATATKNAGSAIETTSRQTAIYNQYLYDQEKAQKKAADSAASAASSALPRMRYALYDVSFAAGIAGAALVASGVAIEATSIKYEALFANVERTTKGLNETDLSNLRKQLLDITSEIPASFDQITQIATLGNQLGIPEQALASFTKTVAEFSATTNSSIDSTATDFGRLGELLNTTDYRKLADDIAYLGVNAVATETQIAKTAQQIAVSTQAANYGVGPTLALATALASLGVKPEQARGSILRTFSQINAAVASGGEKLNDLAAISGKTSTAFADEWKSNASGAFTAFLTGLGKDSTNLKDNLAAIGITAARDTQTLGLLAQNGNVLAKSTKDLADANGYLDKSFGVIAETVSSKLTIAGNNFQRLLDTIGQSTNGPVGHALDLLNTSLEYLNRLLSDPAAAGGVAITVTLVTLAGVALIAYAGLLRLAATALALRTAQLSTGASTSLLSTSISALNGKLFQNAAASEAAAAGQDALAASGVAAAAGQDAAAVSGNGLAASGSKLSGVLGKAGLIGSLLALLPLIPAIGDALGGVINTMLGATGTTDDYTQSILALSNAANKVDLAKLQNQLNPTSVIRQRTSVNGRGTTEPVTQANSSGANAYFQKLTTGSAGKGAGAGEEVIAEQNIKNYDAALAGLAQSGNLKAVQAGLDAFHKGLADSGLSLKEQNQLLPQTTQALGATSGASLDAAAAAKQQAGDTDAAAAAFKDYLDSAYGASNATAQLNSDLNTLGASFVNDGSNIASSGDAIQAVISDIYASSNGSADAANQLQGFFNSLIAGGYATAEQLSGLQAVIYQLTGGKGAQAAVPFSLDSLTAGANKATSALKKTGGAGGGAAKQVKTLVDYGNDLATVFKRAFDIRFSSGTALDAITTGWSDIAKAATEAAVAEAKAHATLASLAADKSADQYWLTVANAYGDTLRAAQIQADLAQNASDTADAQKDLKDAQDASNKSLVGNSDAAIKNRADILGLVTDYQTYIQSLAASGASQAQLQAATVQAKSDFLAQGQALGYSSSQLGVYAAAFDDVTTAINNVPRNITVTANTNPAIQALNEMVAKAATAGAAAGGAFSSAFGDPAASSAAKIARALNIQQRIATLTAARAAATGAQAHGYDTTIQALINQLASGNFRAGGSTGSGNPWDVAGVVHKREFVLNQTGAQMFSPQELAAANQGRRLQSSQSATVKFPSTLTVELSATDRQLLADGKVVTAVISPNQLADATSDVFGSTGPRGN